MKLKLLFRIGSAGFASLMQAATLLLVARFAGPEDFGAFGQLISIGYVAGGILGMGMSARALRLASVDAWRPVATTMMLLRVMTSLGVSGLLIAFALLVGDDVALATAASLFIIGELVGELIQGILAGRNRQYFASFILLLHRILVLTPVALHLVWQTEIWLHLMVGAALGLVLLFSIAAASGARPSSPLELLRSSLGFWFASTVTSAGQLDISFVRLAVGDVATGLYSAGSRIGTPLNVVTNAVLNVYVPAMSAQRDEGERLRTFRRLRTLSLAYSTLLVIASPGVGFALVAILGEDYSSGWPLYVTVTCGAALSGVSQSYKSLCYAEDRPFAAGRSILLGTLIGLVWILVGGAVFGFPAIVLAPLVMQGAILLAFLVDRARNRAWAGRQYFVDADSDSDHDLTAAEPPERQAQERADKAVNSSAD
ncbi:lipopolysaccharide biosynthesis protein [Cryobacterium tepidiphilum]|uniref:lipopolysaccharide biosynthesis protein n=1 Tax=Cryobacterium tepidiphilum TaxID=2486026 RepID=UPI0013140DAD|nr:oligosaccharide flippase family protein [Cryobacterium tepidiphilum]